MGGSKIQPSDVGYDEEVQARRSSETCCQCEGVMGYMLFPWESQLLRARFIRSKQGIVQEKLRQVTVNRFCIHPFSRFRALWDFIMVLVLLTTLLLLPIQVAFYTRDLSEDSWKAANLVIDCIFLLDIIVNFHTGYINSSTDEIVLGRRLIIVHYLTTWFLLDFVSSVPIDYIYRASIGDEDSEVNSNAVLARSLRALRLIKLLNLFRIFRLARLMRIIRSVQEKFAGLFTFDVDSHKKKKPVLHYQGRVLSTFSLLFIITIFVHWNACIQYFASFLANHPPKSWVTREQLHLDNVTVWTRYTHSTYRAISHMVSIGYGHEVPSSNVEMWLHMLSMLLGASFYAVFIGHMSSFVMALNYSGRRYEEKVVEVREYMRFRKIPIELQCRVLDYFEHRYQERMFDEKGILSDRNMSYPLKKDILMHNCSGLVEKVPFLSNSPTDFIVDIIMHLEMQVYFPGDMIVQAGKKGDAMYFIEHGRAEVTLPDGRVVKTLSDGMHFGEISLLYADRRIANVVAIEPCDIYILRKHDFDRVLDEYPEVKEGMKKAARRRVKSLMNHGVRNVHLDRLISKYDLARESEPDIPLIRISSRYDTRPQATERMPSMMFLNAAPRAKISLLHEDRRIANVVAVDISDIYMLRKEDFDRILWDYPEIRRSMKRTARDRLKSLATSHGGNADVLELIQRLEETQDSASMLYLQGEDKLQLSVPSKGALALYSKTKVSNETSSYTEEEEVDRSREMTDDSYHDTVNPGSTLFHGYISEPEPLSQIDFTEMPPVSDQ